MLLRVSVGMVGGLRIEELDVDLWGGVNSGFHPIGFRGSLSWMAMRIQLVKVRESLLSMEWSTLMLNSCQTAIASLPCLKFGRAKTTSTAYAEQRPIVRSVAQSRQLVDSTTRFPWCISLPSRNE
mmetsp:Transcript_18439/g.38615  ORF Transcript_18439/g.38615 Transcript_18439/m.38615 type:complete len:125 (+) Transcript_18439:120-494(+)